MHFEDGILDKAVLVCLDNYNYPPTLPQFFEMCKQVSKHVLFAQTKKTPHRVSNPEVANAHLSQIKTILNMNNN